MSRFYKDTRLSLYLIQYCCRVRAYINYCCGFSMCVLIHAMVAKLWGSR